MPLCLIFCLVFISNPKPVPPILAPDLIIPWIAVLLAVNLQTSFLTPPFGFALFYMKGVAPSGVKIQAIYKGIIPFVALQLLGLALVIKFPEIALWLPSRILD